ncbi:MAG: helicase-related protein [Polyangiaceae bacterium]
MTAQPNLETACSRFVDWLEREVHVAGRGDRLSYLEVEPSGVFWLGRLAPQEAVMELGLGERGERLDPCATGLILRLVGKPPWAIVVRVQAAVWLRVERGHWIKRGPVLVRIPVTLDSRGEMEHGRDAIRQELASVADVSGFSAVLRTTVLETEPEDWQVEIELVNDTPAKPRGIRDPNLYEASVSVEGAQIHPFILESLPDSFRYDRRVSAYGINAGAVVENGVASTVDAPTADRARPEYWNVSAPRPDFRFTTLSSDPVASPTRLYEHLSAWGHQAWGDATLEQRSVAESWSPSMKAQAQAEAARFREELARVASGIRLLETDDTLRFAFTMMNEAMANAAREKYDGWRPFQLGFLLANLAAVADPSSEQDVADVVWFATGGGKTETYLGLVVTAALYDRLTGKVAGITAWSRFPLRMLSLQQTQRFANAIAAAELVRQRHKLGGRPFSCGFLVGEGATPNRIVERPKEHQPDPADPNMAAQFRVLERCPFCRSSDLRMAFDRKTWMLQHQCQNKACEWSSPGLPFFVVDEEIYRFLPTVIVGTLDKAASIALQAAMRGLVGAPRGRCPRSGHGFTYAPRGTRKNGCLVPGCKATPAALEQPEDRFAPTFRLQDELHLLRDSLGAVDAHYEALLDHLQLETSGRKSKVLASSATLTGFEKQCDVLYRRTGRVFPLPGPSAEGGFWTAPSRKLARRYIAIAPRGVTLEYAVDRTLTVLQEAVRKLRDEPQIVCQQANIPVEFAEELLSLYGTNVVYGNTLRDLDASMRSLETQVSVSGQLNTAQLTGRTQFEEVRQILDRLEEPESAFDDRLHVVGASAMMSHGVDVDRLNVMVMLGLPLTTAEFIQATARVGRRWPGIVLVMHKIARERDASVYRSFPSFVEQGDRFVEAIPITRRSRRVLDCTIAGMELARVLMLHEAKSTEPLTIISRLRSFAEEYNLTSEGETEALVRALGVEGELDASLRRDIERWMQRFFRDMHDPGGDQKFPSDLSPTGKPMISLRDVEEQVTIRGMLQ